MSNTIYRWWRHRIEGGRSAGYLVLQKPLTAISKRMAATRSRDNPREVAVRSALHRIGLRYRIHRRLVPRSNRTVDIAFVRAKVAVFLDGCFWHGCPLHGTSPKTNSEWWREKIAANRARDSDTDSRLKQQGWSVVRIWEHVPIEDAVALIVDTLNAKNGEPSAAPRGY